MMVDPDGELAFLIPVAAAVIGGGFNLWSNATKVRDFKSGLAYFTSGAVGGVVSLGNPLLGGSITSAANVGIDLATPATCPILTGLRNRLLTVNVFKPKYYGKGLTLMSL